MPAFAKTLPVPYFTQPTSITCQSTVLKMMATYLEEHVVFQSNGAAQREIRDIWKDVNEDPKRPSRIRNAHANVKWWLERHFPSLRFEYIQTKREDQAVESIVRFIYGGFPVLVSVSQERVAGHIILVVGYANYLPNVSKPNLELIVHDPYGSFDPTLLSTLCGNETLARRRVDARRWRARTRPFESSAAPVAGTKANRRFPVGHVFPVVSITMTTAPTLPEVLHGPRPRSRTDQ